VLLARRDGQRRRARQRRAVHGGPPLGHARAKRPTLTWWWPSLSSTRIFQGGRQAEARRRRVRAQRGGEEARPGVPAAQAQRQEQKVQGEQPGTRRHVGGVPALSKAHNPVAQAEADQVLYHLHGQRGKCSKRITRASTIMPRPAQAWRTRLPRSSASTSETALVAKARASAPA